MRKPSKDLIPQKRNTRRNTKSKSAKCTVCGNETYQEGNICVLCRSHITRMYEELMNFLAEHRRGIVYKWKRALRDR